MNVLGAAAATIFFVVMVFSTSSLAIDDVQEGEDKWPPTCSGSWSLLGLEKWNSTALRCCESDGMCHGFNPQSVEKFVLGSLKGLLNISRHLPSHSKSRSKSSSSFEGSGGGDFSITADGMEIIEEEDSSGSNLSTLLAPCCQSKVTSFLPVSGISAISGKRMAVIQIEPFQQFAISERCSRGSCRFLRGNCTQVYSPQPLYVLSTEGSGDTSKLTAKLDFILVESGCRCHQQRQQLEELEDDGDVADGIDGSLSRMGVDATVPKELRFITGVDFQEDYLAALLTLADNESNNNMNDTSGNSSSSSMGSHSPTTTTIDRQRDDGGDESSHDFTTSSTDPVTFTTTNSWITVTQPTTQLPLPVLPDKHGAPLHIPAGHFNPVLVSIQKFLRIPSQ